MKKFILGLIIGLGFTAGITYAYTNPGLFWTDFEGDFAGGGDSFTNGLSGVKRFQDGDINCYILENSGGLPMSISCVNWKTVIQN